MQPLSGSGTLNLPSTGLTDLNTGQPVYNLPGTTSLNGGQSVSGSLSDPNLQASSSTTTQQQQAAAAAAAQRAQQQAQIDSQVNLYKGLDTQQNTSNAANYRGAANTLLTTLEQGQLGINQDRQNVQANRMMSINDLINNVRAGINSGAINLGNMNALGSSAAEQMARAYGQYGAQAANDINGQANQGLSQDDQKQSSLDLQRDQGVNQLHTQRQSALDTVGNDILTRLNMVDQQAQQYGLSPIDVAGIKQQIIDDGQGKLQAVDDWFNSQLDPNQNAGMARQSNDAAEAQAYQNYQKGILPTNLGLYNFAGNPLQARDQAAGNAAVVQNPVDNSAPIAALPLFTGSKDQTTPIV